MTTQHKVLQRMFVYMNGFPQPTSLMGAMNLQEGAAFSFSVLMLALPERLVHLRTQLQHHTSHVARRTSYIRRYDCSSSAEVALTVQGLAEAGGGQGLRRMCAAARA